MGSWLIGQTREPRNDEQQQHVSREAVDVEVASEGLGQRDFGVAFVQPHSGQQHVEAVTEAEALAAGGGLRAVSGDHAAKEDERDDQEQRPQFARTVAVPDGPAERPRPPPFDRPPWQPETFALPAGDQHVVGGTVLAVRLKGRGELAVGLEGAGRVAGQPVDVPGRIPEHAEPAAPQVERREARR